MSTAAVVIIGDEILTGKFADENGPYFIRRFRELGVDLVRLVTIGDDVAGIADEVARCAGLADHVFTTGGVGPTHDDMTFEGVARAFDVAVRVHPDLRALLDRFGLDASAENLRMATIPEGAELVRSELTSYPIVKVRNVFVFPGVPALVRSKFEALAPSLSGVRVACVRVFATDHETDVAGALAAVQAAHPSVNVGSYPRFGETDHKLIVTLESRDGTALAAARDAVLPHLDVVRVEGP